MNTRLPTKINALALALDATASTRRLYFEKDSQDLELYMDTVVTTNKNGCDWTTIIDDQERQAHSTYPLRGALNPGKQKAHKDGQTLLYQTLQDGLRGLERFEAIKSKFPFNHYTSKQKINGEDYPVATMLLAALSKEYAPMDDHAKITANRVLNKAVGEMPDLHAQTSTAFIQWLDHFQQAFQQTKTLEEGELDPFKEKEIMSKLKDQIMVKSLTQGTIPFTALETKWALKEPKDLDELCEDINDFCKKVNNALDACPAMPIANHVAQSASAEMSPPPDPLQQVDDKACDMCGNPRHDVLQCRAYQQARKKFRAEQQEDRKPGHQVTTNNNRANHGNGNRSPRRWNNKHPRDDRRENHGRNGRDNRNEHGSRSSNSYGNRRADDGPDRRERYSRDNRPKDDHREVRFRHASPPTPASARGGESSSRDAARLAPFSAAALPHDIIVGPEMEFTGHMIIGDPPPPRK